MCVSSLWIIHNTQHSYSHSIHQNINRDPKHMHHLTVDISLHLPLAGRDTSVSHSRNKWKTWEHRRVILHNLSV